MWTATNADVTGPPCKILGTIDLGYMRHNSETVEHVQTRTGNGARTRP
jgi:hypothetical protein